MCVLGSHPVTRGDKKNELGSRRVSGDKKTTLKKYKFGQNFFERWLKRYSFVQKWFYPNI